MGIPPDFLNENKSWRVAVHSCGFDFMLKQPISSKHENQPSLIQITFANLNEALGKHGTYDMAKFDLWSLKKALNYLLTEKDLILKNLWLKISSARLQFIKKVMKNLMEFHSSMNKHLELFHLDSLKVMEKIVMIEYLQPK